MLRQRGIPEDSLPVNGIFFVIGVLSNLWTTRLLVHALKSLQSETWHKGNVKRKKELEVEVEMKKS